MKNIVLSSIKFYQNSGGSKRWFGIECNFEPSCSKYTFDAIEKFGLKKGLKLGLNRINCCKKSDSYIKCIDPLIKE